MEKRSQETDPEEWRRHVKSFKSRGQENKSEYCKANGLVYHRFLYCYEKYETEAFVGAESQWVSLGSPPSETTTHCEFEFSNGVRLKLQSREALSMLKQLVGVFAC